MGLRLRHSFKLLPGLRLNLGRSGTSVSVGRPGATMNFAHGRVTTTVGLPGTGVSYRASIRKGEYPQGPIDPDAPLMRPPKSHAGNSSVSRSMLLWLLLLVCLAALALSGPHA